MNNKELKEIVNIIYQQYIKKQYQELKKIIDKKGEYFTREYNNGKYNFEIYAEYYNGSNIRVRIHGEKNSIIGFLSGFACYFGKTSTEELIENNHNIIF